MNPTTYYTYAESPLGPILLTSDGTALTRVYLNASRLGADWIRDDHAAPFAPARAQLAEYFAGSRRTFDLPIASALGTEFQRIVWEELCRIGYGETITYGEIARRIGQPNAARAVGLANSQNPISIIVPCHRVIGANGKLTGYTGGLPNKQALLIHEGAILDLAG